MSQTATSPSNSGLKGLSIERRFSTAGTHPFDEVEWEVRDALIGAPEGAGALHAVGEDGSRRRLPRLSRPPPRLKAH